MNNNIYKSQANPSDKSLRANIDTKSSKGQIDSYQSSALCSVRLLLSLIVITSVSALIVGGIGIGSGGSIWFGTQPSFTLALFMAIVISSLIILILSALLALNSFEAEEKMDLSCWIEISLFFSLVIVGLSIYGGVYVMSIDQSSSISSSCNNVYSKIWSESLLSASQTAAANLCTSTCPCDYSTSSQSTYPFSGVFQANGPKNATGCNLGISTTDAQKLRDIEMAWNCAGVCQTSKIFLFTDVNNGQPNQKESCFTIASQKLSQLRDYFLKGEMVIGVIQMIILIIILYLKKIVQGQLNKANLVTIAEDSHDLTNQRNDLNSNPFPISQKQEYFPLSHQKPNHPFIVPTPNQQEDEKMIDNPTLADPNQKSLQQIEGKLNEKSFLDNQYPDQSINGFGNQDNSMLISKKNNIVGDLENKESNINPGITNDFSIQIVPGQKQQNTISPSHSTSNKKNVPVFKSPEDNNQQKIDQKSNQDSKIVAALISSLPSNNNIDDFNLEKQKKEFEIPDPFLQENQPQTNQNQRSLRLSQIQSIQRQINSPTEIINSVVHQIPVTNTNGNYGDIPNSQNSNRLGNKHEGGFLEQPKEQALLIKQIQTSKNNSVKRIYDPQMPESYQSDKSQLFEKDQPPHLNRSGVIKLSHISGPQISQSLKYPLDSSIISGGTYSKPSSLLVKAANQLLEVPKSPRGQGQDSSRSQYDNNRNMQPPLTSSRPLYSTIGQDSQLSNNRKNNEENEMIASKSLAGKRYFKQTNNKSDRDNFES